MIKKKFNNKLHVIPIQLQTFVSFALLTSNDNGVPVVGCQTGDAVQRAKYRPWETG